MSAGVLPQKGHSEWARGAGIDGFIYSWWGVDRYEEKPLPRLLDAAQKHRLKVCIYYEAVPQPGDPRSGWWSITE